MSTQFDIQKANQKIVMFEQIKLDWPIVKAVQSLEEAV